MKLRHKLLILSILLALAPLIIAGRSLITISRNELKSAANDKLLGVGTDISRQIDEYYTYTWVAPLKLIQSGVESQSLGISEKLALLQEGMRVVSDLVTLQISVQGIPEPLIVIRDKFAGELADSGYSPRKELIYTPDENYFSLATGYDRVADLSYLEKTDSWLLTVIIPMDPNAFGRPALLAAKINLERLRTHIDALPFNESGFIAVIDASGQRILHKSRADLSERKLVQTAKELLVTNNRTISVEPSTTPNGERVLGCYAFPSRIDWAVVVEQSEAQAYAAVHQMERNLSFWVGMGLLVAILGSVAVALSLSRPLETLTVAAKQLATGDLQTKVKAVGRKDEIGTLANTFNKMVGDLNMYIAELTETTRLKERAESELKLAWNIQKSFLPGTFPDLKKAEIYGTCSPAREVGGDYFDLFPIGEDRYALVIGDVTGKGVAAALFMAVCRTLFRVLSVDGTSPEVVLKDFNNRLVELDSGANMFITIFYGIIDLNSGKMVYSSAGHNMPLLYRGASSPKEAVALPAMRSLVAGIMDGMEYTSAEVNLTPGDTLLMFTDGLIEPIDAAGAEFGDDRFAALVEQNCDKSAKDLCELLVKEVTDFQVGLPQFDDMTLLALKWK